MPGRIRNPVDKYDRRPMRHVQRRVLAALEAHEPEPATTAQVTALVFGPAWSEINRRQVARALAGLEDRGLIRKYGRPDWRGTQRWRSLGIEY